MTTSSGTLLKERPILKLAPALLLIGLGVGGGTYVGARWQARSTEAVSEVPADTQKFDYGISLNGKGTVSLSEPNIEIFP